MMGMVSSFILGAVYLTHDRESDVIDYLEQHGCPTDANQERTTGQETDR